MNDELNMAEALFKFRVDAPEAVGKLESDRKFKGLTMQFEENGRKYVITLSRVKS